MPELYEAKCPHCGGTNPTAEADLPPGLGSKISREVARIIADVYNGNIKAGNIDTRLLKLVGNAVEDAMLQGFGKSFSNVDFTTPDAEMLMRLTRDCWQFSGAKNYQQLRDMTLKLVDENGKARSFEDFRDVCKLQDEKHQKWLRTEYNQAIGSSTMAARWSEYKTNADIMPYLQYSTAGDSNVRDEHALLDGIIRKIDDEFWKIYFPPNGWGCRCSADQLASSSARETDKLPVVNIPDMLRTNLADSGFLFPKGHPYYDGIPTNVIRNIPFQLPEKEAYREVYFNEQNKGSIRMHMMHGIEEMNANITSAKILADKGMKVRLLPVIDDMKLRAELHKKIGLDPTKSPDALIGKTPWEFKVSNGSKSSIKDHVRYGTHQAENVVIRITNDIDDSIVLNAIKGQYQQSKRGNLFRIIRADGTTYDIKASVLKAKDQQ